jgi:D-alanyl-D-alanine carboxypeptidase
MLRRILPLALATIAASSPAFAAKGRRTTAPAGPSFECAGAICVDAATGKVLSEQNPGRQNPPASVTKIMTLLVILDEIEAGRVKYSDVVTADKEAKEMGGTQVALAPGEKHTVEQLMYALMVQSANDAAVALAKHVSGSTDAFVAKMNARAAQLGAVATRFTSPHGLPDKRNTRGGDDMSTARDLSIIARAVIAKKDALRFSAAKDYDFRPSDRKVVNYDYIRNHNKLLWSFNGCDGFKTGWTEAGASIVTTASRGDKRVVAVVLGGKVPNQDGTPNAKLSQSRRNDYAAKLMEEGLAALGVAGAPATAVVAKPASANVAMNGAAPEAVPVGTTGTTNLPANKPKAPVKTKDGLIQLSW